MKIKKTRTKQKQKWLVTSLGFRIESLERSLSIETGLGHKQNKMLKTAGHKQLQMPGSPGPVSRSPKPKK